MGHSKMEQSTALRNSYIRISALCICTMVPAYVLGARGIVVPVPFFLPMHLVLEYSSIVVSFAVFTTGWFGYRQTGNVRDLLIGVTFAATGAFDFIHTLSYKGMPDFLGASSVGKAAAYWTIARLVVAIGLLLASFVGDRTRSRWLSPRLLLAVATVAVLAVPICLITIYDPASSALFYDPVVHRLTPLKVGLEYLIIGIYICAFFAISEKRGWEPRTIVPLRSALLLAAFAEFAFTLYATPYDPINALGHVFKAAAYLMILNALFLSAIRRPYDELALAKDELQALYVDAQEHRKEIEQSFSRIGSALSSSLNLADALELISQLAVDMLHVDCSIVAALENNREAVQVTAQRGGCHKPDRPMELALEIGKQAIARRSTVIMNDVQSTGLVDCDFTHTNCLRAMICVPMIYEDVVLGVIAVYSHKRSAFDDGDVKLLEAFAVHAAVATYNAMIFERESRIADVLQRALLSSSKVMTDRFEIAQVYQPAMNEALVGGDFYDVVEIPNGKIGLVIGDVSGKGLRAAVHTAMVKYTLRAYLDEGHGPAVAMRLLNRVVVEVTDSETFITLFLGLLDTRTGELIYANAGHEPPVYSSGGSLLTLPSTGAALGFLADEEYWEGTITLDRGSVLLLYTDGISEARRGKEFLSTEGIGNRLLTCKHSDSEDIAKCVHRAAVEFSGGELKDDAAILAVRARS